LDQNGQKSEENDAFESSKVEETVNLDHNTESIENLKQNSENKSRAEVEDQKERS